MKAIEMKAPMANGTVILKRTYNQEYMGPNGLVILKFWRVMSPSHQSYLSDLSVEGLKEWKVII